MDDGAFEIIRKSTFKPWRVNPNVTMIICHKLL